VYEFREQSNSLEHYVYNNQFDGEYLLPEFKHLDFLWLMKGDVVSTEMLQQKTESLRNIGGVQLVVELTTEKIKNKEHLVF
ncbi:MAG: IPExxxVDY family protein, partial [Chitinophagaceae bacterium]